MSDDDNKNRTERHRVEAKIIAMLLDEVSDFERDDLMKEMEKDPDLKAFYERIKGTIGVIVELEIPQQTRSNERIDQKLRRRRPIGVAA